MRQLVRMPRPYGANAELETWIAENGYRYSPTAHCLHWVSKGRCAVRLCNDGHFSRCWMDHVSGWTKNGERMLLCQPYHFADVASLAKACEEFDLMPIIHGDGWYGHGTIAIELRPRHA